MLQTNVERACLDALADANENTVVSGAPLRFFFFRDSARQRRRNIVKLSSSVQRVRSTSAVASVAFFQPFTVTCNIRKQCASSLVCLPSLLYIYMRNNNRLRLPSLQSHPPATPVVDCTTERRVMFCIWFGYVCVCLVRVGWQRAMLLCTLEWRRRSGTTQPTMTMASDEDVNVSSSFIYTNV